MKMHLWKNLKERHIQCMCTILYSLIQFQTEQLSLIRKG